VLAALAVIPNAVQAQDEAGTGASEPAASTNRPVKRLALVGGTVLTISGPPLEAGDVLIENGKIAAVGRNLDLPEGTTVFDVSGRTLFPGLIDAGSTLGLPKRDAEAGSAGLSVKDGLDPFDRDRERVLAAGVTTVFVTPKLRGPSTGTFGSVIKIRPGTDPAEMVLVDVAAVRAAIGVSRGTTSDTLTRWRSYQSLERTLKGIKSYTESLERYRKSLEKWKNDLREWRQKAGIPIEGEAKAGARSEDDKKRAKKKDRTKEASRKPSKKKKVPRRPKKPREPRPDPVKQALAEALDRKIPLRIEAHRAEDIRRALTLARNHGFPLVLEGATEAGVLAGEIKKAGASVVLGPLVLFDPRRLEYAKFDPESVAVLARLEIPVALASASTRPSSGRFLPLIAAAAGGHGLGRDGALRAVTLDAAKVLGVEKRLGSIEVGKDADLVIADRHPLDTECRVETVLIEGEVVHGIARPSARAPGEEEKQ
jgi:imidazolonepropionase-like amidohydrolase